MKVLVIANDDFNFYKARKELLSSIISKGNDVYISIPKGDKVPLLEEMGCKYIETNFNRKGTNPLKDVGLLFKYIKIIKDIKPNCVLTFTIKPNIYGGIASRITKTKYIANITGLGTALENNGFLQKILIFMYRMAFKKIDCCFTQNKENMQFIKKHILSDNRVKLLPGSGVNLNDFKVLEYPKENDKIKFLFISRLMKEKGIEQYMDAAEEIKKKYSNVEFHVLGASEKKYEEKLEELLKQNVLIYHGRQDDTIPFLKESSCTILPSFYPEGMNNVLLESCASGRPIITTNRAGCGEIVDNEVNGYIVEEKNSKDLIEKVEKFLQLTNEERKQMGLAGRKKVEKEFDREIVVEKYLEEIER